MTDTTPKTKQKMIKFGLSRNYGAVSVNFEVSELVDVANMQDQMREMEKLIMQVWTHHDEYAKAHLHKTPPPQQRPDGDYKKPDAFLERIPVTEAVVTIDGGKRYVKLKGGRYVKHGVVIWDEYLKKTDIDQRLGSSTRMSMEGYTMVVDTSGRPKVVEVIPPNGA